MSGLLSRERWIVRQRKEWVEILVDWETRNQYRVQGEDGAELGMIAERKGGLGDALLRAFLRSHRGLEADVFDAARQPLFRLARPFFFLFSTLHVTAADGRALGRVERRFGILYKRYDLHDARGNLFAEIKSPLWRLWTFPLTSPDGRALGTISKRWSGALKELFTDSDAFLVDVAGAGLGEDQRAVVLAAAMSIDFDFFEENDANAGLLSAGGS